MFKRVTLLSLATVTMSLVVVLMQPATSANAVCLPPCTESRPTGGILGGDVLLGLLIGLLIGIVAGLFAYRAGVRAGLKRRDVPGENDHGREHRD